MALAGGDGKICLDQIFVRDLITDQKTIQTLGVAAYQASVKERTISNVTSEIIEGNGWRKICFNGASGRMNFRLFMAQDNMGHNLPCFA